MVFKFATFDPAQDPDDFNPAFPPTPSSSPSATLCQPCEYTYTFTKAIVSRLVAAGASLVFAAPAFEFDGCEIQDESTGTQFYSISSDVRPKFHQRQLKEFTLKELKAATRKFSNKKVIGRGGFGTVYEGQIADGSLVAIKRRKEERTQGTMEQFKAEVMAGSIEPPHPNLLPLLGYCRASECTELLLVYPLMVNKSVDCFLSERPETPPLLDWLTRRKIAVGAARGLSRLHDLNIVHRDIKPSNILLDEEFEPHIGDFGIAKLTDRRRGGYLVDGIEEAPVLPRNESEAGSLGEDSYFTNGVCGTCGYMAPEYAIEGKYSVKTDVFAFGVMLLQLVTGQRAHAPAARAMEHEIWLPDWVKGLMAERRLEILVDPHLQGEYDQEEIEKVIQLALLCTHPVPRERPFVAQVVQILEGQSIDERWEEYRHSKEYLISSMQLPTPSWRGDVSSSLANPEELSGPR